MIRKTLIVEKLNKQAEAIYTLEDKLEELGAKYHNLLEAVELIKLNKVMELYDLEVLATYDFFEVVLCDSVLSFNTIEEVKKWFRGYKEGVSDGTINVMISEEDVKTNKKPNKKNK